MPARRTHLNTTAMQQADAWPTVPGGGRLAEIWTTHAVTIDLVTAWLTHLNATAGLFCSIREAVEDHEAAFLAWLQAQRAQTPQDDIATMFQLATDLQTARALLAQLVARCGLSMVLEEVVLPVLQNAVAQPLDDDETA